MFFLHDILDLVKKTISFISRRNTQVRLKGSVLKTDRRVKPCGGSNPSSSAIFFKIHRLSGVFL